MGLQASVSLQAADTDQTVINRRRQAEYYLTFCLYYSVDILSPTLADACRYMQFLVNSLSAHQTRKNYVSGARTWVLDRDGDPSPLTSKKAKAVLKGAMNINPYAPSPAPPLLPEDLTAVCSLLATMNNGLIFRAALTLGFFGFLRASNLLTPSATLWAGPHSIRRRDVLLHPQGLAVVLRSSKTIKLTDTPEVLALPYIPGAPACPTAAWVDYVTMYPWTMPSRSLVCSL